MEKAVHDWQQTIDEEKAIAFEEGATEQKRETAQNFLRMNILAPEQIAQGTGLPPCGSARLTRGAFPRGGGAVSAETFGQLFPNFGQFN